MKNIKAILPVLLISFLLAACARKDRPAADDEFVLKGKFQNAKGEMIKLEELTVKEKIPVDSVKIGENGDFSFRVKLDEAKFYILQEKPSNFVTLLLEPGETAEIKADLRQIANTYEVSGSEGSRLIMEINRMLRKSYAKVDSLQNILVQHQSDPGFVHIKASIDSSYLAIYQQQKAWVKRFIDENTNSLASIIAIYQYFGQTPVISEEEDFSYYEKLNSDLMEAYPKNQHAIDFNRQLMEKKQMKAEREAAEARFRPGSEVPDIALKNPQGTTVALSSLKGKVVLIDFWASWCAPCRAEIPNLKSLYNKYKGKGFEIYGVSLDRDRNAWVNTIKLEGLNWVNVSDLKFWSSPVVNLYGFNAIPYSVLIDKEGRVIAKNLRGKILAGKLAEIFAQ